MNTIWENKKVVIVGLGLTGLSCAQYFLKKNIIPRVIDTRKAPPERDKLPSNVPTHFGGFNDEWILDADCLVVSPGIALSTPILQKAHAKGIDIVGDIELFCREINVKNNKYIIAITGSNGKTTVTTMVGEVLQQANKKVVIGGNVGIPILSTLDEDIEYYVLELSSFQLETTTSLQATVAVILNISEDHSNRYPEGIQQYINAKQRIYNQAKTVIYNIDDEHTYPVNENQANQLSFGLSQGDYHLNTDVTELMYKNDVIMATAKIGITGIHNYLNCLSVFAIAEQLKILRKECVTVLSEFKGLSHRFETIVEWNGIRFINDSKATNVGSSVAALKGLTPKGNVHILLGGDGKAADFSPLKQELLAEYIYIYCYGSSADILVQLLPHKSEQFETMQQALDRLFCKIKKDDVVLLSPACASLDQFKNYQERGDKFKQWVMERIDNAAHE